MSEYVVREISPLDGCAMRQVCALLARTQLSLDAHLDLTVGLYDEEDALLATGSLFGATLRCLAVEPARQGEGLLNRVVAALVERALARGVRQVFVYTKCEAVRALSALGFYEIERVPERLAFMTNRPRAFAAYVDGLARDASGEEASAIVMNANPFTLGHLRLLEHAAGESRTVYCFVVSEDASLVPFQARLALVKEGAAHLANVVVKPSGAYIISNATFPSYFLKDDELVTRTHAQLDIRVFAHIARALHITRRFAGEEPFSGITRIYNEEMARLLPESGIQFIEIPRAQAGGMAISASAVRRLLKEGPPEAIRPFVPDATYRYFTSEAGRAAIERIRAAQRVEHD